MFGKCVPLKDSTIQMQNILRKRISTAKVKLQNET